MLEGSSKEQMQLIKYLAISQYDWDDSLTCDWVIREDATFLRQFPNLEKLVILAEQNERHCRDSRVSIEQYYGTVRMRISMRLVKILDSDHGRDIKLRSLQLVKFKECPKTLQRYDEKVLRIGDESSSQPGLESEQMLYDNWSISKKHTGAYLFSIRCYFSALFVDEGYMIASENL